MHEFIKSALEVLEIESGAIRATAGKLDQNFVKACEMLLACRGRVIVMGIGKSGHVGRKIAATLASTGTPAFFVHAAEAAHGDLGMVTADDVVIMISNSGETQEILTYMPVLKRLGCRLLGMTGKSGSTLAGLVDINLDVGVEREACGLGLAPTTSTIVAMAVGDALAVSILRARGFTEQDFARSHPGGLLGRRLLVRVEDVMHGGEDLPRVVVGTSLAETILEISRKRLGMVAVVDSLEGNRLLGVCTDGDLRRAFSGDVSVRDTLVSVIMSSNAHTVYSDVLATEALRIMQERKVTALPVLDRDERLVGALNVHDLFSAGVV